MVEASGTCRVCIHTCMKLYMCTLGKYVVIVTKLVLMHIYNSLRVVNAVQSVIIWNKKLQYIVFKFYLYPAQNRIEMCSDDLWLFLINMEVVENSWFTWNIFIIIAPLRLIEFKFQNTCLFSTY